MRDLYINSSNNKGYLSEGVYSYVVDDKNIIQNAQILSPEKSVPNHTPRGSNPGDLQLIFIEISYDPLSRLKRGKFYKIAEGGQPHQVAVMKTDSSILAIGNRSDYPHTSAYKFVPFQITHEFKDIKNSHVYLMNNNFKSKWKFLNIDPIIGFEEVCVIQEVHGLGVIPILSQLTIPSEYFSEINNQYSSLLAELHGSPESIIDHCRDTVTSLLSGVLDIKREDRADLGALIVKVDEKFNIVRNCAGIINRLHPRRKPNEIDKHSLRELTGSDADFAVQAVFLIIKELKWNL